MIEGNFISMGISCVLIYNTQIMGNLRIQSFSGSMQLNNIYYARRWLKNKKSSLLQTIMLNFLSLLRNSMKRDVASQ